MLTVSSFAEEGRLGREPSDYKYTSLGIDLIQTEDAGIGADYLLLCLGLFML